MNPSISYHVPDHWNTSYTVPSRDQSTRHQQLDRLIREGGDRTIMNDSGDLPETTLRAALYLEHLDRYPDAVQIMLFRDDEGAQRAWAATEGHEEARSRLEVLLAGAGWRADADHLVRSETYYQELQALQQTIANDTTKRSTPEQGYRQPDMGRNRVSLSQSQSSQRSNGLPSVHSFSSVSQGPNRGATSEMASFLSHDIHAPWVAFVQQIGADRDGMARARPSDEQHSASVRAVVDETVRWTETNTKQADNPKALALLSARGNVPPEDLNNSLTNLQENKPQGCSDTVVIHKSLNHPVNTHRPQQRSPLSVIARCCNWLCRWR